MYLADIAECIACCQKILSGIGHSRGIRHEISFFIPIIGQFGQFHKFRRIIHVQDFGSVPVHSDTDTVCENIELPFIVIIQDTGAYFHRAQYIHFRMRLFNLCQNSLKIIPCFNRRRINIQFFQDICPAYQAGSFRIFMKGGKAIVFPVYLTRLGINSQPVQSILGIQTA